MRIRFRYRFKTTSIHSQTKAIGIPHKVQIREQIKEIKRFNIEFHTKKH